MFAQAMSRNKDRGLSLSNIRIAFNSGANNRLVTNRLARMTGMSTPTYHDPWNDAVPQIAGLRAGVDPIKYLGSLLSVPLLFTDSSPHSEPK